MESVPAAVGACAAGADQPRIRAALRNHGPRAVGGRGVQLLRTRHRQHGSAGALRQRRAAAPLARTAARRRDPFGLPDDRARRRLVGRDQHPVLDPPRRQRLRDQRAQVVFLGRRRSALRGLHRHGQDRSRRGHAPAAVDDPRAVRRARHPRTPAGHGVRLRRRAARAYGHRSPRRARAGRSHHPRRRARLRDRAGTPRSRPHPSLHAQHRARRGRAGTAVPARDDARRVRPHARRPFDLARTHRRGALPHRTGAPADAEGGRRDGQVRQQGRARRDRDDQGRRAEHGAQGHRLGDTGARRRRRQRRFSAGCGPDEVHRATIAKLELARYAAKADV